MSATKKVSPFPTVARKTTMEFVDPSMLKVEHNTPIPTKRRVVGKYDHLFASMRSGSCIACEFNEFQKIANGLRKWLERNGKKGKIVSVSRCEDGKARVWLVEA